MKLGTPGFIGLRLREAREARGLTQMSLAEILGLTRAAVSSYEAAERSPSPEVMQRISDVLKMPASYFRYKIRERKPGIIFFRSMQAATNLARRRAEQRYTWLREIVSYLRSHVQFPTTRLPNLEVPDDLLALPFNQIDRLAMEARRFYNLGDDPVPSVVSLLESNGVIIARDELGADTLDAFSEYDSAENSLYMFLGTENAAAVRSRFDAAHELGHALLHRTVDVSTFTHPTKHSLLEKQAHRFAAAFLLPEASFCNEFYSATIESLVAIKSKWKVSVAMMIMRAQDLGFVSEDGAKKLWIAYSRRKWRCSEPLDDKLIPEQPKLLRRCFDLLFEKRIITKEHLLMHIPLACSDLERLAGLDEGFLSGKSGDCEQPIIALNVDTANRQPSQKPSGGGLILQFPKKIG